MYLSKSSVFSALTSLSSVGHNFTRTTGNADLLAYFLILKKLNMSNVQWLSKDKVFEDRETILATFWQLGGLFSDNEIPKKKCCLMFSSFCKKDAMSDSHFYNKGTEFRQLAGRFKDTIDNTAADYLLDKGLNDTYRFKSNVISILLDNYTSKFQLDALVIWIYRTYRFDAPISVRELKRLFLDEFKISSDESRNLFDTSHSVNTIFDNSAIAHSEIRNFLNTDNICEVAISTFNPALNFNPSQIAKNSIYNGFNMINDSSKIKALLSKNKQVVLTGVPGTGKSFTIEELREHYKDVQVIQFHQNYTYQDFLLGKTIKNGNVVTQKGELFNFIDSINDDGNYLLVLDEINRGNISSIFGEALFALDRGNEIELRPDNDTEETYKLSLPDNLHILGTMNSADRSIAIIDFAIRRRFLFVELKPDYDLIDRESKIDNEEILGEFLRSINNKIYEYFENEDYFLGHSYFLSMKEITIEDVYDILHYKVIPMLIEYAHGEKEAISHIFPESLLNANNNQLKEEIKAFANE